MFEIQKEYAFSASHTLVGLPSGHPCGRLHGHNYVVRFLLRAPSVDETGFVLDYRAVDALVKPFIDHEVDHRDLNEVFRGMQPSAERLAEYFFHRFKAQLPDLAAVSISETPKTWATYRGSR